MAQTYTLTDDTVFTMACLRNAIDALKAADRALPPNVHLYLLPDERYYFAKYGWIKRHTDGRLITTERCPVCSAGIEIRHVPLRLGE